MKGKLLLTADANIQVQIGYHVASNEALEVLHPFGRPNQAENAYNMLEEYSIMTEKPQTSSPVL